MGYIIRGSMLGGRHTCLPREGRSLDRLTEIPGL